MVRSIVHNSLAWFARKVLQMETDDPPPFQVTMYRRMVLGACSTPSFALSSSAIRSSPHPGLSDEIRRIKLMWLRGILGHPGPPDRRLQ